MVPLLDSKDKEGRKAEEDEDEEEDDYLTMVIPDTSTGPETSLQRRRREQREVSHGICSDRRIPQLTTASRVRSELV